MSECAGVSSGEHHHRGRSSEALVDKHAIVGALAVKAGEVVLDAGCGNGYMAKELAKLVGPGGNVYALDPDEVAVETLRKETAGSVIEAFVGDITAETKLAAASVDLIYLCTVVHGFGQEQMEGFVKEAKRLLRNGGRLAVVEIKKEETGFGPAMALRFSPEELQAAVGMNPAQLFEVGQYFYMQVFAK